MTSGLGKYLENYLKPIGNEPPKLTKPPLEPKKEVLSVLSVPTIGVSGKKSCQDKIFISIHLMAIRRISRIYPKGTLQFTKANHPELDAKIKQAENGINNLWLDARKSGDYETNLPRFRKLIRAHVRLTIKAIRL